jgi:hypothetical protein
MKSVSVAKKQTQTPDRLAEAIVDKLNDPSAATILAGAELLRRINLRMLSFTARRDGGNRYESTNTNE